MEKNPMTGPGHHPTPKMSSAEIAGRDGGFQARAVARGPSGAASSEPATDIGEPSMARRHPPRR
jgi:hypothetical protein